MSAKYGDDRDPYLYPTLDVLRNRLGIRQAQRLEQTAWEFTSLRAATIPLGPRGRGLPHLCAIHRQLYQDLFDWAGKLREIDIYQGDTPFCHFAWIEKEGNALMRKLEEEDYLCEPTPGDVRRTPELVLRRNQCPAPVPPWQRPDAKDLLRTVGHSRRLPARLAGY